METFLVLWLFIFALIYYLNREGKNEKPKEYMEVKKAKKNRDFLEKKLDSNFSKKEKEKIFEIYNNECYKCGSKKNLTIDHHLPLSMGYPLNRNNAVLLCKKCNNKKSSMMPNKFYTVEELRILEENYHLVKSSNMKLVEKRELKSMLKRVLTLKGKDVRFNYLGKVVSGSIVEVVEEGERELNKGSQKFLKVEEKSGEHLYPLKNIKEIIVKGVEEDANI